MGPQDRAHDVGVELLDAFEENIRGGRGRSIHRSDHEDTRTVADRGVVHDADDLSALRNLEPSLPKRGMKQPSEAAGSPHGSSTGTGSMEENRGRVRGHLPYTPYK